MTGTLRGTDKRRGWEGTMRITHGELEKEPVRGSLDVNAKNPGARAVRSQGNIKFK